MPRSIRRTISALAVLAGVAALAGPASAQDLGSQQAAAGRLQAAVDAESARIAATRDGLADAQRPARGARSAASTQRQAASRRTRDDLVRARVRLTKLQKREAQATRGPLRQPRRLLQGRAAGPRHRRLQLDRLRRPVRAARVPQAHRGEQRAGCSTTRARRAPTWPPETRELERLRTRFSAMARGAITDRNRADVMRTRCSPARRPSSRGATARARGSPPCAANIRHDPAPPGRRRPARWRRRSGGQRRRRRRRRAATASTAYIVARVVAAANQIASTPYVWGGGHGGASGGYDCSGSVSYALAAGGLLDSPLDSTGFMSWGDARPGPRASPSTRTPATPS